MSRYETCCRHSPALFARPKFREFLFACSFCGLEGPPASNADAARKFWDSFADRCIVFNTEGDRMPNRGYRRTV